MTLLAQLPSAARLRGFAAEVRRRPVFDGTGIAAALAELARRVDRLRPPGHRDPEAFHLVKSDIAAELRRLAAEGDAQRAAVTAEIDDGARPRSGRFRA